MCMIDNADERPSVSHSYDVRASRKEHRCSECRRTIVKGEPYRRTEMAYEGSWYTFRTCRHCRVAALWLVGQCGGYLHEGVLEDVEEHVGVYKIARLHRLLIGMRRKWQRFDAAGLMQIPQLPKLVAETAP